MLRIIQIGLLTLCWFCVGQTSSTNPLQDLADIDNNKLIPYICDDGVIENIDHRLEKQNLISEILTCKLNLLQTEFNQKINDLKIDIIEELQNLHKCTAPKAKCEDKLPATCAEAVRATGRSGVHQIQLKTECQSEIQKPFFVYCEKDTTTDGDAWTIVQRRENSSIIFYRNWTDYKYGFGNLDGNFFIGLEQMYALTQSSKHELWVQLEDFENATRFAKYKTFAIGSEAEAYALNILGNYSGDAGDSLRLHQGCKFTTFDVDNDASSGNCAKMFYGAWWYNQCHSSNLNGLYLNGDYPKEKYGQGIDWQTWHGHYYSLKYVHMAIRSVL